MPSSLLPDAPQSHPMRAWLWLSALVIVLDQASKYWILQNFALHEGMAVWPHFNLIYVRNTGAAFSFLADAGGWQRWFFLVLSVVVSLVLIRWIWTLPPKQKLLAFALAMILGGALGNAWDRLAYGYVIDFLDVYYNDAHWPAFNVADSAITIGAFCLIWDALFYQDNARR